jgi:TRAP-type mannitol/chloroaromatic compound transport system substrate-binding protein
MNKRILAMTLVILVLALSLVAIGCPPVPVEPPVPVPVPPVIHRWVAQTLHAAGVAGFPPFVRFAERVYEATDGRIVITPHPCGAIVGVFEKFDALREGVLDAMHSWPSYWVGKDPAFGAIPGIAAGIPEPWQLEAWFMKRGGLELMRELYGKFDLFPIGVTLYGPESNHFVKPVDTLEEFQGLLFRTPPAMTAALFAALGAEIVIMPGPEVYLALEKGIIEGAEFMPMSIMYDLGIHEVAPYFVTVGFHMPTTVFPFTVRRETWEALGPELQSILECAVADFARDHLLYTLLADLAAREAMLAYGNTELFFPEEDLAKVREKALGIWEEWAGKSPMLARIIHSQIDFMRELGVLE